jgi:DNA-binding NtrC family response regulator
MVELHVPSLTERLEDLPLLQRHFLQHFAAEYKKPISGLTRRAQASDSIVGRTTFAKSRT